MKGIGLVAEAVSKIAVGPVLKTVHLVTAAKVHLAYKAGPIAVGREVGRPGSVFGKDCPMIRPGAAAMRIAASHHGHSARCAHGIRAGGTLETDGSGSETIQIVSIDNRIARKSCYVAVVLIRQNPENIRVFSHVASSFFPSLQHD